MLIVGELINTSRSSVAGLVTGRDAAAIADLARRQSAAGADYIDVNAGTFVTEEPEYLEWLVTTVQETVDTPVCIDSPNPAAIIRALARHRGKAIVNSITAEKKRFDAIVPLVREHGSGVVALCMDDTGMPDTVDGRIGVAEGLAERLAAAGVAEEDIYFDPLVRPVSTDPKYGPMAVETIRRLHEVFPRSHTICGLSNVSFGLPARKMLNQTFLVMCMTAGLDAVILDPLDERIMADLFAADLLAGHDEYGMRWIGRHREGLIPG